SPKRSANDATDSPKIHTTTFVDRSNRQSISVAPKNTAIDIKSHTSCCSKKLFSAPNEFMVTSPAMTNTTADPNMSQFAERENDATGDMNQMDDEQETRHENYFLPL